MALPEVVSREEWLIARKELLSKEKALTRQRDALNSERRRLPMVKVESDYVFEGPDGAVRLIEMFDGARQLMLQHLMFDPSWEAACPACTGAVDEISSGFLRHLRARETAYAAVSRAPIEKIEAYKRVRAWEIPWYSSFDNDFNYDFHVTIDESRAPAEYNYRGRDELIGAGMDWMLAKDGQPSEQPGLSFFLRDGDDVFHTYSTFARGTEQMAGVYAALDLTALGRQEDWEEPKGRADNPAPAVPDFS